MAAQLRFQKVNTRPDRRTRLNVETIHQLLDESDISDLSDDSSSDSYADEGNVSIDSPVSSCSSDDDSPIPVHDDQNKRRTIWKKIDTFAPNLPEIPDQINNENPYLRPVDYFKEYVDNTTYQLISEMTNVYHLQNTGSTLCTTPKEIRKFVGASILMGCVNMKRIRLFWQRNTRMPVIANAMPRNRYYKIRNNLKIVDNLSINEETKQINSFWKVRPFINTIQQACLSQPMGYRLAIDEQMISFTGRCPSRQYVPRKPFPTGSKNVVLASETGLVHDFVLYQGPKTFETYKLNDKKVGQGVGAVMRLIENVTPEHHIFCDRFFTNIDLILKLKENDLYFTGTINKYRIPVTFTKDSVMKKQGRGTSEQFVSNNGICVLKWYDNKPVYMCSTVFSKEPTDICQRWSKPDKEKIPVVRPRVIKEYNISMGGVDLCDRMLAYNKISSRSRRWPVRVINHFLDLSISNSWIKYRKETNSKMQCFDFRVAVAYALINENDDNKEDEDQENRPLRNTHAPNPIPVQHSPRYIPLFIYLYYWAPPPPPKQ